MKPKNFPRRKLLRKLAAGKSSTLEVLRNDEAHGSELDQARLIRTKKRRGA